MTEAIKEVKKVDDVVPIVYTEDEIMNMSEGSPTELSEGVPKIPFGKTKEYQRLYYHHNKKVWLEKYNKKKKLYHCDVCEKEYTNMSDHRRSQKHLTNAERKVEAKAKADEGGEVKPHVIKDGVTDEQKPLTFKEMTVDEDMLPVVKILQKCGGTPQLIVVYGFNGEIQATYTKS